MAKFLGSTAFATIIALGLGFASNANAADVTVSFEGRVGSNIGTINEIEQKHESYFREYLDSYQQDRINSARKFNTSRLQGVNWAGAALVPEIGDFTLDKLVTALVEENLKRAGMEDLEGTIRVNIKRMKVAGHSTSALRGGDTFVVGTMEHLDAKGNVLNSTTVSVNLVYDTSVDVHYQGPDFAFYSEDGNLRVGPILSRFVEKGLENLFKGTNFYGPVLIGG